MTTADVPWAVDLLAERRAELVPHAPVYWQAADDAAERHEDFLSHLLDQGGGVGFRTGSALMIAAPRHGGWTIDDATVGEGAWADDGGTLLAALGRALPGAPARFVCPASETDRLAFASAHGFVVSDSWWHWDVPGLDMSGPTDDAVIAGAAARLVPAPAIYDPGGPVLFLTDVESPSALADAQGRAGRLGAPLVVVSQPRRDLHLATALAATGFVRHCDFLDGNLPPASA